MNVNVRRASIEDLKSIQNLNNELFKKEFREYDDSLKVEWPFENAGENYFRNVITNGYVVVATDNEEIIGYLAGSVYTQNSYNTNQIAELDNMFIKENYRNSGIGKKLVQSFIIYCNEKEIDEIRVTASWKNKKAIEFYIKNGFEEFELTLRRKKWRKNYYE